MKRIIEPLTQMGAHISSLHGNGCAPLVIEPGNCTESTTRHRLLLLR